MTTIIQRIAGLFVLSFFVSQAVFASEPTLTAEAIQSIKPISSPEELISVEFNEADIQSAFKILALKGNVNIVASPQVIGKVTMQLHDVPWMNAFETIVKTYGFSYEKKGNIYEILTPAALKARNAESEIMVREVFSLNYAQLDQVTAALKKTLSKLAAVESIAGTNQIVITDEAGNMDSIRKLMKEIDTKMLQVHIETKIVRTTLSKGEKMGLDWSPTVQVQGAKRPVTFPFTTKSTGHFFGNDAILPIGDSAAETSSTSTAGGGVAESESRDFPEGVSQGFPFVQPGDFKFGTVDFSQFTAMFNMLSNRNSTKIISNPRIVVMNHQSAQIQVGDEIGIPTLERNETSGAFEVTGFESRNTGIVLKVTPHISKDRDVQLKVRPEVTKFLGFQAITASNLTSPQFETVVAETTVMVHSGDTLVIGGLISDEDSESQNKVPYLSEIPVAGWMFKSHTPTKVRTETIFFITVTLVDDVYNKKALEEWHKAQKNFAEYRKQGEKELNPKKNKSDKK